MLYVIVFHADPRTLEDTLLFMHHDAREAFPDRQVDVLGVAAHEVRADGTCERAFRVGGARQVACRRSTCRPDIVHFLHLDPVRESATHAAMWACCERAGIPAVNPYNDSVRICESKQRTYSLLQAAGIPTPETRLVSRFNRDRRARLSRLLDAWKESYVQPDLGTEGRDTFFCDARRPAQRKHILARVAAGDEDFIVRRKAGDLTFEGANVVLRLNVTCAGHTFRAESGYAMLGGDVVSPGHHARREALRKILSPYPEVAAAACQTAVRAVDAVFKGAAPPLVAGVDIVVDVRDGCRPWVLDINPRPVVVGSRLIGQDRLFLGDHFWRGVQQRARAGS